MKENESIESLAQLSLTPTNSDEPSKRGAGPPIKYTEDKVSQFIALLQRGAQTGEALDTIGISMATHSRKLDSDPDYATRVTNARAYLKVASRLLVHKAIDEKKDLPTAKWYLEKEVYDKERNSNNQQVNFFTQINNFAKEDQSKFIDGEVVDGD
jgi:hypothetical protein